MDTQNVPTQHPVTVVAQPPSYANNNVAATGGEKQLPAPAQQPVVVANPVAAAVVADNAIAADAIRMTYLQYITIQKPKAANVNEVPPELAQRGLSAQEYADAINTVKQLKSKSDTNKIFLWTGCIFCCGIIGYLLVQQRAVGNKKLSKQLESPLEDVNRKLMARGVPIRWLWVEGSLRAYYK